MVYKKYIKRNGKLVGPYYYESYREDGKIKTRYLGSQLSFKKNEKNNFSVALQYLLVFLAILGLIVIGYFSFILLSGNIVLDVQEKYGLNEELGGNLSLIIEDGDFVLGDSEIRLELTKNGNVLKEATMSVGQFLGENVPYVEVEEKTERCENITIESIFENCTEGICVNETIYNVVENCTTITNLKKYYNASGTYKREISEFFNYSFIEEGDYNLVFSIPSLNISKERVLSVAAQEEEEVPGGNESISEESDINETINMSKEKPKFFIQQNYISSCGIISSSGDYELSQNISSSEGCLKIISNDVVLDCNGYKIEFNNVSGNDYSYGVLVSGVTNVRLLNCLIETKNGGNNVYGIYINESESVSINNSDIRLFGSSNYGGVGVYSDYQNNNNEFVDIQYSTIILSGYSGGRGIYLRGALYSSIFKNNLTLINGDYDGIEFYLSDFINVDSNSIFLASSGQAGVSGIQSIMPSVIYNNIFIISNTNYNYGVSLSAGCPYSNVNSNNITINATTGTNSYGILLSSAINSSIFNNNISVYGDFSYGVSYSSGGAFDYSKIYKNKILLIGQSSNGIYLTSGGNREAIYNNSLLIGGNKNKGFYLNARISGFYYNNNITIDGNASTAFELYNSRNISLYNNEFYVSNFSSGLFVRDSTAYFDYYVHNISTNNKINGLPIYYFVYAFGKFGESPECLTSFSNQEVGHLSLIGCAFSSFNNLRVIDGVTLFSVLKTEINNSFISGDYGVRVLNSLDTTFFNNTIRVYGHREYGEPGESGYGIMTYYSNLTRILFNNISTNFAINESGYLYGIYSRSSNQSFIISNSIMTNGYRGNNKGIYVNYGKDIFVLNNIISTNSLLSETDSYNDGVRVGYTCANVSNNIINTNGRGNYNYGIYLDSSTAPSYSQTRNFVFNNSINSNGISYNYGLLISSKTSDLIYWNDIKTNGSSENIGISFSGENSSLIYNKIIANGSGSGNNGIYCSGCSNMSIINNNISSRGDGLYLSSYLNRYSANISNNVIIAGGEGLSLATGRDFFVYGNSVFSNGSSKRGILISSVYNSSFLLNNFISERYRGVDISSSNNNSFVNCNVSSYGGNSHGIFITGSLNRFINVNINLTNATSSEWYSSGASPAINYGVNVSFVNRNMVITFIDYNGTTIKSLIGSAPAEPQGKSNIGKWINATRYGANSRLSINFSYNNSDLGNVKEETLKVWRYNNTWTDSGFFSENGVDLVNKVVYVSFASISSPYSIFAPLGDSINVIANISNCSDILLPGNYSLNKTLQTNGNCIRIFAANVSLDCKGYGINGNKNGDAIYIYGNHSINIRNCNIYNFTNGIHGEYNISNVYLFNNTIRELYDFGIRLINCTNCLVEKNFINKTINRSGIYVSGVNIRVFNNTIGNSGESGLLSYNSRNITFDYNNISSAGAGRGFSSIVFGWVNDSFIKNNFVLNGDDGIYLSFPTKNVIIDSNYIYNSLVWDGISVKNATNITITNNIINISARNGIHLLFDSVNSTVANNKIYNVLGSGIFYFNSYNNSVRNNQIYYSSWALDDESGENNVWEDNYVYGATSTSMYLENSINLRFSNISIENSKGVYQNNVDGSNFSNINFVDLDDSYLWYVSGNNNRWENVTFSNIPGIMVYEGNGNVFDRLNITNSSWPFMIYVGSLDTTFKNMIIPSGLIVVNESVSEVNFTATINASLPLNLTSTLLEYNKIRVRTNVEQRLNRSAVLVFWNISYNNPRVMIDYEDSGSYVDCPSNICRILLSTSNGTIVNVSHFTTYTIQKSMEGNLSCVVVEGGCKGSYANYTDILHLSNYTNAHAELVSYNNYNYSVCCRDLSGNYNLTNSSGTNIVDLSNYSDAHLALPGQEYGYKVYFGAIGAGAECIYKENSFGVCDSNYSCIFTISKNISGSKDMHAASCNNEPYDTSICCAISSAPVVELIEPYDGYYSNSSMIRFNCSAIASAGLKNITLYVWNSSGLYLTNINNITGNSNSSSWNVNLADNLYYWNCLAYDNNNIGEFASLNRTLVVDTTKPKIKFEVGTDVSGSVVEDNKIFVVVNASDEYLFSTGAFVYNATRDLVDSVSGSLSYFEYTFVNLGKGIYYFNAS
ncbi:MAG: right-handed parallel beta-helix repeat-containing protein, partial [Candidatus Pacearchaeota archaeon]|nr:right-handed parallel beta-helix repeat-containing protein [Candidatus Pacearchaeota archaeon]